MITRLTLSLLLLFPAFVGNSQDLQDQLFLHNAKQLAQTKEIPNLDTILLIEQFINKKSNSNCSSCQAGMHYALSRLFWLSDDIKNSKSYLKKTEQHFNKSFGSVNFNQEITVDLLQRDLLFADHTVLKELNLQIGNNKGKDAVFFLTGYGLVHQYYLSMVAQSNPEFEHTLVEGASNYAIIPLLFELYGQSLTQHEQSIHDQLNQLAAYLEDLYIQHEEDLLAAAADLSGSLDKSTNHMTEYKKLLGNVLLKI